MANDEKKVTCNTVSTSSRVTLSGMNLGFRFLVNIQRTTTLRIPLFGGTVNILPISSAITSTPKKKLIVSPPPVPNQIISQVVTPTPSAPSTDDGQNRQAARTARDRESLEKALESTVQPLPDIAAAKKMDPSMNPIPRLKFERKRPIREQMVRTRAAGGSSVSWDTQLKYIDAYGHSVHDSVTDRYVIPPYDAKDPCIIRRSDLKPNKSYDGVIYRLLCDFKAYSKRSAYRTRINSFYVLKKNNVPIYESKTVPDSFTPVHEQAFLPASHTQAEDDITLDFWNREQISDEPKFLGQFSMKYQNLMLNSKLTGVDTARYPICTSDTSIDNGHFILQMTPIKNKPVDFGAELRKSDLAAAPVESGEPIPMTAKGTNQSVLSESGYDTNLSLSRVTDTDSTLADITMDSSSTASEMPSRLEISLSETTSIRSSSFREQVASPPPIKETHEPKSRSPPTTPTSSKSILLSSRKSWPINCRFEVSVKDLPKMDSTLTGGKCDPYFKFEVDGKSLYGNSKLAKSNKLAAAWSFSIPSYSIKTSKTISVKFYDRDRIGKDELIGSVEFSTAQLASRLVLTNIPLEGKTAGQATMEIQMKL